MDSGSGVKPGGWIREAEKPSEIVDQASTSVSVTSNAVVRTSNRPCRAKRNPIPQASEIREEDAKPNRMAATLHGSKQACAHPSSEA